MDNTEQETECCYNCFYYVQNNDTGEECYGTGDNETTCFEYRKERKNNNE